MPKPSLPVRLALLVAGTTLPLIMFAVGIVFHDYIQDRAEATQRVLETVRSTRLTLDAEMQRMTGGLQVLALTDTLKSGDFESFRRIAAGFLDQYGKDGVILVSDREGRVLFSSLSPDTASLPLRNNREIVERVFVTGRPQYSNVFEGAVKNCRVDLQGTADTALLGSRELLRSAIENVLRNAVRYSPNDTPVQVIVSKSGGGLEILIRDHGPGVPAAELERIFEPFYRVAESRDRDSGGEGIGLAITSQVMKAHGGSAQAVNGANGGLEVRLRLPGTAIAD